MTNSVTIRVWSWKDAPDEYKALSNHGGDEDWVALIPCDLPDLWVRLPFDAIYMSSHNVGLLGTVYIGAHA
jgi:hypothetical protein